AMILEIYPNAVPLDEGHCRTLLLRQSCRKATPLAAPVNRPAVTATCGVTSGAKWPICCAMNLTTAAYYFWFFAYPKPLAEGGVHLI
ncbi:MAG: hypothetical protein QF384_22680, partial [Alphaproteobacteria bacterium]|nr:hypothetical protein [Alphaproteobacteria bacterium]